MPRQGFVQLKRLTLVVGDAAQVAVANQAAQFHKGYDLIAVRPMTAEAWQALRERSDFDIISLPLDEKLAFSMRRAEAVRTSRHLGVVFVSLFLSPSVRSALVARTCFSRHSCECVVSIAQEGALPPDGRRHSGLWGDR